ncbi:unnamed protein product [Calicophoron daubneyi]|uniref:SWIM-type domain-containing protein n=1 Tax=Calicophoron daubneyi TaxID=300641 RepID=A0AAV2TPH8_CALDB
MAVSSGYSWSVDQSSYDHARFEAYFGGRTFSSYYEFEEVLKKFQEEYLVTFRVWSSLLSAPGDPCVYRRMTLICTHGNFDEESESAGIRKRRRKNGGCRARFSVDKKDGVLVVGVRSRMLVHNHRCSEVEYRVDPVVGQLTTEERMKVMRFLLYGMPIDGIRSMARQEYKKELTRGDVNDIKCHLMDTVVPAESWSEFESLVRESGDFSCTRDKEGRIECISFRRTEQAKLFELYPEVVSIDIIHNVNRDRFRLLQFVVTDGLGHGRCVMYSLMRDEECSTYITALSHFRDLMPNANKVQTFVVGLNLARMGAIRTVFRRQKILLCQVHVVRAVHRNFWDRLLWNLVRCLMRTTSIARFSALCLRMRRKFPRFYIYFFRVWLKHAHRWAVCYLSGTVCLGNLTNDRTKSVHRWLKEDLYAGYSLFNCCKRIWVSSHHMLVDYECEVAESRTRRPLVPFDHPLSGVVHAFTRYAAKRMLKEWKSSNGSMSVVAVNRSLKVVEQVFSRRLAYKVDVRKRLCSCVFHQLYGIPCRHLLFACLETKVPMDNLLVKNRWLDVNLDKVEPPKVGVAHLPPSDEDDSDTVALVQRASNLGRFMPAHTFEAMMNEVSAIMDEFEFAKADGGANVSNKVQDRVPPLR